MRPGWNPVRRNRNIGTKASGHGQDNRLVIPSQVPYMHCYWEKLDKYVEVRRMIGSKEQIFFVEPPRNSSWFYPCTIDDMVHLLGLISKEFLETFDFIVLRQSTRKQRILRPVWGRAQFWFDLNKFGGSAIIIEAVDAHPYTWFKTLDPESARELERLKSDGHRITLRKRDILIEPTASSLRNTVLFRTLVHEIGHHLDFYVTDLEAWDSKTSHDKEDYAHRFASLIYQSLLEKRLVPFEPIHKEDSFIRDGLQASWFLPSS